MFHNNYYYLTNHKLLRQELIQLYSSQGYYFPMPFHPTNYQLFSSFLFIYDTCINQLGYIVETILVDITTVAC